jgi:hypothetical protein
MLHCTEFYSGGDWSVYMNISVEELLESVFQSYCQTYSVDDLQLALSRERVTSYLSKLASAGRRDPQDLADYAKAYLKELREGPDPRCTGC